jgi:hypothetical protein
MHQLADLSSRGGSADGDGELPWRWRSSAVRRRRGRPGSELRARRRLAPVSLRCLGPPRWASARTESVRRAGQWASPSDAPPRFSSRLSKLPSSGAPCQLPPHAAPARATVPRGRGAVKGGRDSGPDLRCRGARLDFSLESRGERVSQVAATGAMPLVEASERRGIGAATRRWYEWVHGSALLHGPRARRDARGACTIGGRQRPGGLQAAACADASTAVASSPPSVRAPPQWEAAGGSACSRAPAAMPSLS